MAVGICWDGLFFDLEGANVLIGYFFPFFLFSFYFHTVVGREVRPGALPVASFYGLWQNKRKEEERGEKDKEELKYTYIYLRPFSLSTLLFFFLLVHW